MPKGGLSEAHKKALAKGRRQAKAVRNYLDAIETERQRGRSVDEGTLKERINKYQSQIDDEDNAAKRVELIQKRLDAEKKLAEIEERPDMDELQAAFAEAVEEYSARKGITYTAWREAGVPASVLRDAGVPRTRRTA